MKYKAIAADDLLDFFREVGRPLTLESDFSPISHIAMASIRILAMLAMAMLPIGPVHAQMPGVASFVVPTAFPTSVFSSYYVKPAPTIEPQPALYDPILNITYPLNLTDPTTVPTSDNDPLYFPKAIAHLDNTTSAAFVQIALAEIKSIIYDQGEGGLVGNCSKCIAALSVGKLLAQTVPEFVPNALVSLCESTGFGTNSSCKTAYTAGDYGDIWTQVLALSDVAGLDGRYICYTLSSTFCPFPTTTPLNTTSLFPKPKPANATAPPPSGERVKVLHLSDFHLDARYQVASEANCTSGLCCRYSATATSQAMFPAPLYGSFRLVTPSEKHWFWTDDDQMRYSLLFGFGCSTIDCFTDWNRACKICPCLDPLYRRPGLS